MPAGPRRRKRTDGPPRGRVVLAAALGLVLAAATVAPGRVSAQSSLSLRLGPSWSSLSARSTSYPTSRRGVHVEALLTRPLGSTFRYHLGLGFVTRGGSGGGYRIHTRYVQFPVGASWVALPEAVVSPVVLVGVAPGLRVSCAATIPAWGTGCDNEGQVMGGDVELFAALGLQASVAAGWSVGVHLQRNMGLIYIAEYTRHRAWSLTAGVDAPLG